ncbi:LADA_0D09890g1_1 [Lachancea dasiensis]|uniref:E3 ubiquitin-protein ligase n=1 Tax=Lachancea dasiensis TaxID=1072105 RepID=A0A1G4J7G4_9SACH|nr:LADA_0D09890g1_1 [Lachancea dasiensis]
MAREERPVREFLVSLPRLANESYHEVISYVLWQTLDECVTQGIEKVDWLNKRRLFDSLNWKRGVFQSLQLPSNWRDGFFSSNGESHTHEKSSCGRISKPTETVFYCFDCTRNPLYEICDRCFDPQHHMGHRYTSRVVVRPEGRICHCGDGSVFISSENGDIGAFKCRNSANNGSFRVDFEQERDTNLVCLFEQILDYILDATALFKEQSDDIARTFMAHDNGTAENCSDQYVLQLCGNECSLHIKDLSSKISSVFHRPPEFGVMMTDMLHRGEPSVTILRSSNFSKLDEIREIFAAQNVIVQVKKTSDVFKECLVDELTNWIYKFCTVNTSLCGKLSLRVAICGIWQSGLLSNGNTTGLLCPFTPKIALLGGFVVPFEQRQNFPWAQPWTFPQKSDTVHDPQMLQIMQVYDRNLQATYPSGQSTVFGSLQGSRLQHLLVQGTSVIPMMWKFRLPKIVSSIFSIIDDSRNCIAAQYIDIYPNLLYDTVASDSAGYKLSLMSCLSQLVFQIPTIANMIVTSGFIERITQVAFTLMSFSVEDLAECPPVPLFRDLKLPSDTIKNKRSVICFKDIYLVMSTNTVPELLLSNQHILWCMIKCFCAFNNVLPLSRETSEHIEYENFDFSSYYFYFSSILVMVDGFTRNICQLQDPSLRVRVVHRFLRVCLSKELEFLKTFKQVDFSQKPPRINLKANFGFSLIHEAICDTTADIISFQVGSSCQNFFNPMSYFFKFVTQWSHCGRYAPLSYSIKNFFKLEEIFADKRQILWMCESSLSTLVLIAQINAGFWVRNGSPIQHQARMYTRYSMREFTYFSDLYMLQMAMSIADPNEFMVTYISRWGLKNWAQGTPIGDYPESEITISMVDQCLLLLIQLLSETRSLTMKSSIEGFEKTIQTELVHALCFKNSTYSELLSIIPEHVTKHPAFDLYLHDMASFSPPNKLMDAGIFTLKREYFKLVDPYFIGFISSKRYEAEKLVRESMAAEMTNSFARTFVPAADVSNLLGETFFENLYQIAGTDIFGHFIKNTLIHVNNSHHDSLLGKVTHIIHLCIVNNAFEFGPVFWKEYGFSSSEYPHFSSIGSLLYSFLSKDEFLNEHGKIREIFRCCSQKAPYVDMESILEQQTRSQNFDLLKDGDVNSTERKDEEFLKRKMLAKAKRLKIMKHIARQQQKFLANNQSSNEEGSLNNYNNKVDDEHCVIPESTCVFCKMDKDDDMFVYFSYLERNLCGRKITLDKHTRNGPTGGSGVRKEFLIKPVIRTCGHGAHEGCLFNHMKSTRTAHNHITKNVPSSLGFSLAFCPLCSALTNSFLPHIRPNRVTSPGAPLEREDFDGFLFTKTSETCRRAVAVLHRLLYQEAESPLQPPLELLSKIQSDAIKNAEAATRSSKESSLIDKVSKNFLKNQHMITLVLISQMKKFMATLAHPAISGAKLGLNSTHNPLLHPLMSSWDQFIGTYEDVDLLDSITAWLPTRHLYQDIKVEAVLKNFLDKGLHQDFVFISELLRKNAFTDDMKRIFLDKSLLSGFSTSWTLLEADSIVKNMEHYCPSLDLSKINLFTDCASSILYSSMIIRMRKLTALLCADGLVKIPSETDCTNFNDLNNLLTYCGLPPFEKQLRHFSNTLPKLAAEISLTAAMARVCESPHRQSDVLSLCLFEESLLIRLPPLYSELIDAGDDALMQLRFKRGEIAICLFCGDRLHVQHATAIHNYSIGECTDHCLYQCPSKSVYGCFLLVLSNATYLSYGHRGTFFQAPFLNKFGETDEDYRTGSPVFLNQERYLHLSQDIVLGNMIPHLVFRLTDNNSDLGGWESI